MRPTSWCQTVEASANKADLFLMIPLPKDCGSRKCMDCEKHNAL